MLAANQPEIIDFGRDMTLRWPCRQGDFILWIGYLNILSGSESMQIRDLWEMRDGYHATITNRPEDLPAWFELHPTKVCDVLALKMMAKMEKGYKPGERIDGPNLWRLKSGDRVAWVGAERPERPSVNGILAILDCDECALAVGEGNWDSIKAFVGFGAPSTPVMNPEDVVRRQAAVKVVKQWGLALPWGPDGRGRPALRLSVRRKSKPTGKSKSRRELGQRRT